MQIYMVGGAIRDKILKRQVHDKDFVVTGSTEDEMISLDYIKVGKSFPVFLHPQTKEEYALARKEIKTGLGHKDFKFIFTPDVTLEDDSLRRDFTCNSLYQNINTGEIIDYHHGIEDINHHILRHVSEHFLEDPLRVLRMCRFAAQLDFEVAPETMEICKKMVADGALAHLSKDRIWQEFEKALSSKTFYKFIEKARECGALKVIMPEMEQMFFIPERKDFHPEGNSGKHTLLALKAAQSDDAMVNFAIMLHDIGKTKTDPKCWPSHHGHDNLGEELIKTIGKRLRIPAIYTNFASYVAKHHMLYHQDIAQTQVQIANIAIYLERFKSKNYFNRFILALRADMLGRNKEITKQELDHFDQFSNYLERLIKAVENKKVSDIPEFESIMQSVKNKTMSPSKINDIYIETLLKENPYV